MQSGAGFTIQDFYSGYLDACNTTASSVSATALPWASNDSTGLGWPGRLGRGLGNGELDVAVYNLGINGDTSAHIAARWRDESTARSRNAAGADAVCFRLQRRLEPTDGGELQVALNDSVNNAREIMTAAKSTQRSALDWTYATGRNCQSTAARHTPPGSPTMLTSSATTQPTPNWRRRSTSITCACFPSLPAARATPRHWSAGDRVHPGDDGYAMIAERISAWDSLAAIPVSNLRYRQWIADTRRPRQLCGLSAGIRCKCTSSGFDVSR